MVEPLPAPLAPDMRRDEPGLLRQRHQLMPEFLGRAVRRLPRIPFARQDFVTHETLGALLQFDQIGGDREVHVLFSVRYDARAAARPRRSRSAM